MFQLNAPVFGGGGVFGRPFYLDLIDDADERTSDRTSCGQASSCSPEAAKSGEEHVSEGWRRTDVHDVGHGVFFRIIVVEPADDIVVGKVSVPERAHCGVDCPCDVALNRARAKRWTNNEQE